MNESVLSNENEQTNATRPRRRWFQFSLRTFLILLTVVCLLLGLWIVPSERQRRAAETIDENGDLYAFAGDKFDGNYVGLFVENADSRRWYDHYFKNIIEISSHGDCEIDWGAFPYLEKLTHSSNIKSPSQIKLNELLIALTKHNRRLRDFSLNFATIQSENIEHISSLRNLEKLDLSRTNLENCSFNALTSLTKLCDLNLLFTNVQDSELVKLRNLRNLKVIHIEMSSKSADRLKILCEFKNLEEVNITIYPESFPPMLPIPIARVRNVLKEYNQKSTPEHPYEIKWD